MSDPTSARDKVMLVFVRELVATDNKKRGRLFYQVSREEFEAGRSTGLDNDRSRVFGPKVCPRAAPGQVYEFEAEEGGRSIYVNTALYAGLWPDDAQRLRWEADHLSYVNRREAEKLEAKDRAGGMLRETLASVRELYQRTPRPRKQALLAAILYEITREGRSW